MAPELEACLDEFKNASHQIVELVAGLDDEQVNQRADDKNWSMAECIDHLVVVGWKMIPQMDTAIIRARGKGWSSDGPFKYGWFEKWFAASMGQVPPRRKFRAPRLYVPPARTDFRISELVDDFKALQDKYAKVVHGADGLDIARIKVASPALRLLRLSLGQWLIGLAGHQRRHLWQAEGVKRKLLA
jgi:hypothetical protein